MERINRRYTIEDCSPAQDHLSEFFNFDLFIPATYPLPEPVLKEGWSKLSKCYFTNYHPTYLTLSKTNLNFFSSNNTKSSKPCFSINFSLYTIQVDTISETEVKISSLSNKHTIKLKFSQTELTQWVEALRDSASESLKSKGKLSRFNPNEKFWKNFSIPEESFLLNAQCGDLLLFRGKNFGCKLQRCITRSKFDHIGLVIRFKSGEIGFLEASRAYGVSLTYWDTYFKKDWKKIYSEIWYKKLDLVRTSEMISDLERFIKNTKGKGYSLKLGKKKRKVNPGEEDTFFCSELIASAYKVLGIISNDELSYKFYPSHFEGSDKFEMAKGELCEEVKLDMDYIVLNN